MKDFNNSMELAIKREKQNSLDEQAKVMIRYLLAIKEELLLRIETENKDEKLLVLKRKVEEKEIESERREKVAESKFYGAFIEIIDRLRDELKDKSNLNEDMVSLKRNINEIKESLNLLLGEKTKDFSEISQ